MCNRTRYLLPPANVWGKVIFSVACVKNSVHRGVCLSACWDTTRPQEQTPPGADNTPREQTTPLPLKGGWSASREALPGVGSAQPPSSEKFLWHKFTRCKQDPVSIQVLCEDHLTFKV